MEPKRITIVTRNFDKSDKNEYLHSIAEGLKENGYVVNFLVKHFNPNNTFAGLDVNSVQLTSNRWKSLLVAESDIFIIDALAAPVGILKSRKKMVVYIVPWKHSKIFATKHRIAQKMSDVVLTRTQVLSLMLAKRYGYDKVKYLPPCAYYFGLKMNGTEYRPEREEFCLRRLLGDTSSGRIYLLFYGNSTEKYHVEEILEVMKVLENRLGRKYNDKLMLVINEPNYRNAIAYTDHLRNKFETIIHKNVLIFNPSDFTEASLYAHAQIVFFLPNQDISIAIKALYLKQIVITFEASEITDQMWYYRECLVPYGRRIFDAIKTIFGRLRSVDISTYMELSYNIYLEVFSVERFYTRLLQCLGENELRSCKEEIEPPILPLTPFECLNEPTAGPSQPTTGDETVTREDEQSAIQYLSSPEEQKRDVEEKVQALIHGNDVEARFELPHPVNSDALIKVPEIIEISHIILKTSKVNPHEIAEASPKKKIWTVKIEEVDEDTPETYETIEIRYDPVLPKTKFMIYKISSIVNTGASGSHRQMEAERIDPTITAKPESIASQETATLEREAQGEPRIDTDPTKQVMAGPTTIASPIPIAPDTITEMGLVKIIKETDAALVGTEEPSPSAQAEEEHPQPTGSSSREGTPETLQSEAPEEKEVVRVRPTTPYPDLEPLSLERTGAKRKEQYKAPTARTTQRKHTKQAETFDSQSQRQERDERRAMERVQHIAEEREKAQRIEEPTPSQLQRPTSLDLRKVETKTERKYEEHMDTTEDS